MGGIKYILLFLIVFCSVSVSRAYAEILKSSESSDRISELGRDIVVYTLSEDEHNGRTNTRNENASINKQHLLKDQGNQTREDPPSNVCPKERLPFQNDFIVLSSDKCQPHNNSKKLTGTHLFDQPQRISDRLPSEKYPLLNLSSDEDPSRKSMKIDIVEMNNSIFQTESFEQYNGHLDHTNPENNYPCFDDNNKECGDSDSIKISTGDPELFYGPLNENVDSDHGYSDKISKYMKKDSFLTDCIISDVIPDRISEIIGVSKMFTRSDDKKVVDINETNLVDTNLLAEVQSNQNDISAIKKEVKKNLKPIKLLLKSLFSILRSSDNLTTDNLFVLNTAVENSLKDIRHEIEHIKHLLENDHSNVYNDLPETDILGSKKRSFSATNI